jgi:hypothetical protein
LSISRTGSDDLARVSKRRPSGLDSRVAFVFLYVGRDLDERTRRIMTFLAEGARMTFFAVEIDHFHAGDAHTSVLVPRTAFVPSWVSAPGGVEGTAPTPMLQGAPLR